MSVFSTRWCQIERYCDSLQNEGSTTWNGEVAGKKWIMNCSQKLWPGTANWLVYNSMCIKAHFFHHKGAFNKNVLLSLLEIWLLLAEMYCPKVYRPTFYSHHEKSFWVLKNKFLWFSHRNTQLSLHVWSQKIVTKGALYFQFSHLT